MRVRVVEFARNPPLVLQTDAGLEAVVVGVGGVFLLRDARKPSIGSESLVGATLGWSRGQRIVVDVAIEALVPGHIADILNHPDNRGGEFMLHAKAELCDCGSLVGLGERCQTAWIERGRCRLPSESTLAWSGEIDIARVGVVGERRIGRRVVNVIALETFVEGAEAAAKNRPAGSTYVIGETD